MNDGLFSGVGFGRPNSIGRFSVHIAETTQVVSAPSWAKYISLYLCGGGGGGGGGRLGTTTGAAGGGGGAGGGAKYLRRVPLWVYRAYGVNYFEVTIGAGGNGGAGSTVDGTNGSNGTAGGATTVRSWLYSNGTPSSSYGYIQSVANGGALGPGGTTGAGSSATGGQGYDCVQGGNGGNSNTGGGNFPLPPINVPHMFYAPQGGLPGQGKNTYFGPDRLAFMRMGISTAAGGNYLTLGSNGDSSERIYSAIVSRAISELAAAPPTDELWFCTHHGGIGGTGGDTTTGSNGGAGGAGWRGSGGGGGGGAGTAGFVGGAGGAGGNGVAIFFWEEY